MTVRRRWIYALVLAVLTSAVLATASGFYNTSIFQTINQNSYLLALMNGNLEFHIYPDDSEALWEPPRFSFSRISSSQAILKRLQGEIYIDLLGNIMIGLPAWWFGIPIFFISCLFGNRNRFRS